MTNKTPKILHEITPREYVDIDTAFDRHPALHGIQLEADTESTRVSRVMTGETKTIHTAVGYGLWMSPAMFSALIKILNAAPSNGDPLQAIVNLDLDTTANEAEREALVDYLSATGYNPTLENIAAAYLHEVKSNKPLLLDVVTDARREYAITCVTSRYDNEAERYSGNGKCLSTITFNVPTEHTTAKYAPVTVVSEQHSINIEDLEGSIIGSGMWRIMHVLEPAEGAALGGFILEPIKEEED